MKHPDYTSETYTDEEIASMEAESLPRPKCSGAVISDVQYEGRLTERASNYDWLLDELEPLPEELDIYFPTIPTDTDKE
jgi:hypothetical protein